MYLLFLQALTGFDLNTPARETRLHDWVFTLDSNPKRTWLKHMGMLNQITQPSSCTPSRVWILFGMASVWVNRGLPSSWLPHFNRTWCPRLLPPHIAYTHNDFHFLHLRRITTEGVSPTWNRQSPYQKRLSALLADRTQCVCRNFAFNIGRLNPWALFPDDETVPLLDPLWSLHSQRAQPTTSWSPPSHDISHPQDCLRGHHTGHVSQRREKLEA